MATTALATKEKLDPIRLAFTQDNFLKSVASALPKHMRPEHLVKVALGAISRKPELLECTRQSLMMCLLDCAQYGLEPSSAFGHAYLVAFKNHKKNGLLEAQLLIGYRGYIELAMRTGKVTSVEARVVYENDHLEVQYGTDSQLVHVPCTNGEPGKPIAWYAVAHIRDARPIFEFMTKSAIDAHRKMSKAPNGDAWTDHYEEMGRKTAVRALAKYMPLSPEMAQAIEMEERIDAGESMWMMEDDDVITGEVVTEQTATEKTRAAVKEKLQAENPVTTTVTHPHVIQNNVVVEPKEDLTQYANEEQIQVIKKKASEITDVSQRAKVMSDVEKAIEHYPTGRMPMTAFHMILENLNGRL